MSEVTSPPGVLVLGMHRSGTSVATRLVNLLGPGTCPPEDMVQGTRGNPTGHWESQSLVDLNDRILSDMGRSWWCPPPPPGPRYDEAAARITVTGPEARHLHERLHPTPPWVWKDPRTTTLLPFWRACLPGPLVAVVMVRNPLDTARSLQARNGFGIRLGVALWERHTRLLLGHLVGMPALVTRYDDLVEDPGGWLGRLRAFLGSHGVPLAEPATGAGSGDGEAFVEAGLRHSSSPLDAVEAAWPDTARLARVVDTLVGCHPAFPETDLPLEPAWVEAELVAVGAVQQRPQPRPGRPVLTVVTEGRSEADRWVPPLPPDYHETVEVPEGAAPRGERRNRAVAGSRGDVLVFTAPGVRVPPAWWAALRAGLAAGHGAVAPVVLAPGGNQGAGLDGTGTEGNGLHAPSHHGYGLRWTDRWLNRQWLSRPEGEGPWPVLLLPDACFAVTRDAFDDVGGFDPALGAHGLDTAELCLRLWRAGHSCAVVDGAVADARGGPDPGKAEGGPSDGTAPEDAAGWTAFLADLVRLGSVHFDPDDLAWFMDGFRSVPGFAPAAARAQAGDLGRRRRAVEERGCRPAAEVLGRFGIEMDPTKHRRAALYRRAGADPDSGEGTRPQGEHTLVFVGGLHGSGLGVVTRALGAHPLASAFAGTGVPADEGQHLQDVYRAASAFGGPGRFALDPAARMDESDPAATPTVARHLFGQWSPHWDLSRPVLVEKSPPNLIRSRFLQALFPGSRFVMVARHPVAVALQTTRDPVADMEGLLTHWFAAWETFEADRLHLDAVEVVAYEAVLADPDRVAAGLGRLTGLEGLALAGAVDPGAQEITRRLWAAAREAAGTAWLDGLVERFGARAAAYGYDLADPVGGLLEEVPGPDAPSVGGMPADAA